MKSIILILSLVLVSVAGAEVKKESKPLKNKAIIKVIDQALTDKFDVHTRVLFSSFDGLIKNPLITVLTFDGRKVIQLDVSLTTSFSTFDYDFGDPVDELIETQCKAILTKNSAGRYSQELVKISCDEDPLDYLY